VQLDVVADAEAADHVEQLLERDPLCIEQQLDDSCVARSGEAGCRAGDRHETVVGGEDPQVAEHLALRRQERGVAAAAGAQRLDVVRHLTMEERLGVRPGERQLARSERSSRPAASLIAA